MGNNQKQQIENLIKQLANFQIHNNVFNQYESNQLEANNIRRRNLLLYLEAMADHQPSCLFVGEAPGHRGARLTGIPFTSERIMLNGVNGLFGQKNGFEKTNDQIKVYTESTATIFWQCMEELKIVPLVWNAFPFHPFKQGKQASNRVPNLIELTIGGKFLKSLIQIFNVQMVIAVGKKAGDTLDKIGISHETCRHPSYGGQKDFKEQVKKLVCRLW